MDTKPKQALTDLAIKLITENTNSKPDEKSLAILGKFLALPVVGAALGVPAEYYSETKVPEK